MQFTYPLYSGEDEIGSMTLQKDRLRLYLQAESRLIDGVNRAWAVSGDNRLLIGVMMPEGDNMHAKKTYNLSAIGNFDLSDITHGELGESPRQKRWQRCRDPRSLFSDEVAQKCLDLSFEYWAKIEDNCTHIAIPWHSGKFPIPALFCLCSVERVNGKQVVMLQLNSNGIPSYEAL